MWLAGVSGERLIAPRTTEATRMKYGIAWLLGVPVSILAVIYLVSSC
jgi:hypothetical protein